MDARSDPAFSEPAPDLTPHVERFQFTGDGSEYFRIWIVNLLLSIATLGIYSAWAKVRRQRYFYGNTRLAGSAFGYHAQPIQILKGRLIAAFLFVVYLVTSELYPAVGGLLAIMFFLFIPAIVARALRFRARVSSYRNIRFDFDGTTGDAVGVYIGRAMLVSITLGIYYPAYVRSRYEYAIDNTRYADARFTMRAEVGVFYGIYLRALALLLLALATAFLPYIVARGDALPNQMLFVLTLPVAFVLAIALGAHLSQALQNATIGSTTFSHHRLLSTLEFWPMFKLHLSNALLILVTLGLYIPWAQVRIARYRFDNLTADLRGTLDAFIASQSDRAPGAAAGEEVSELFDVELGA